MKAMIDIMERKSIIKARNAKRARMVRIIDQLMEVYVTSNTAYEIMDEYNRVMLNADVDLLVLSGAVDKLSIILESSRMN